METIHSRIAYLDGIRFRRALQAGIHRVLSRRDHLNRINVFPVADGDTGTNIAFTLQSMLAGMSAGMERHVGRLLTRLADSALDGARGNSGAILAQFFQGLSDAAAETRRLTPPLFARAVDSGAAYAREALTEPKEGTLLSVMRDYARELSDHADVARHDFVQLLNRGLRRAEASLAETTNQLSVLRRAGVVDAGAQGFVEMLRGIDEFLRDGSVRNIPEIEAGDAGEDHALAAEPEHDDRHRYCTECIIEHDAIDHRKLREAMAVLGTSLVVAGSKRKARVHIHVDDPRVVFRETARWGTVSGEKADDMHRQTADAGKAHDTAAVITDSAGDIADPELERLGIHTVPVRVHFGTESYLDKITLTAPEFYRLLMEHPDPPTTSQPPPGDFRRQFEFLGSHYEGVVSIHVSAAVSGTFQSARTAAERTDEVGVHVVDSRNVSVGQGLVAMEAAEWAAAGHPAPVVAEKAQQAADRTRTWGLLATLRPAVRGGRVSPIKRFLAERLHLNPVLATKPDGRVGAGGILFGHRDRLARFGRFIARRAKPGRRWRVAIGHCDAPLEAAWMREWLQILAPHLDWIRIAEVSPALGAHAGPGAIVVSLHPYAPPHPPAE